MNQPTASDFNPLFSVRCIWQGLAYLHAPGLRRLVWLPLVVNLVVYSMGFLAAGHYFSIAMDWLLPNWLDWMRWLLWPLLALSLLVIAFFTFTLVANLLGSPFYGELSAQVQRLRGEPLVLEKGAGPVGSAMESLGLEFQRLKYLALRAVPILVLLPIPGINVVASVLWMALGAWTLALEYFSYPLENRGFGFAEQRRFLAGRRIEVLVFGGTVMLGLTVPVLNILIPPAAVIGATLYCQARKPV
jgi:CysZ protein